MGFTRGLAAEVGRHGVTANCVALGTMKTGAFAEALEQNPELEAEAGPELPGAPGRRARRPGRARGPALQRRRGLDHRPGVPRRRRLRQRPVTSSGPGEPIASPDLTQCGSGTHRGETTVAGGAGVTLEGMATRRRSKTSRARRSKGRSGRRTNRGVIESRSGPPGATTSTNSSGATAPTPSRSCWASSGSSPRSASTPISPDRSGGRSITARPPCSVAAGSSCPSSLVVGALALVTPRWGAEDDDEARARAAGRGWRLGIGFALAGLAAVGLMHLARATRTDRSIGSSTRAASSARSRAPLRAALGPAGAVIVLVAIGCSDLLAHRRGTGLRQLATGVTVAGSSSAGRYAR